MAHEIRNPLNFVRNFAEATDDLIVELKDSIQQLDADEREEISEIIDNIATNLTRVESHALRADRIVNDMLKLGEHGGNFEPTDLNELLSYSVDLAYNGSKTMHPDLELDIQEKLDPDVGEVSLIAGRCRTGHPKHRQQLLLCGGREAISARRRSRILLAYGVAANG